MKIMKDDLFTLVVENVEGDWLARTKFFEKYDDYEITKWLIKAYKRTLGKGLINEELEEVIVKYYGKQWLEDHCL